MPWKTLKTDKILETNYFNVEKNRCQKENGHIVDPYFVVNRPDVVVISAFTNKMEVILIEQYRYPVKDTDFELPAGYCESTEEDIKIAAERELLEETGFTANLFKIKESWASAGFMSNKVHYFLGLDAKKIQDQNLEANEEIKVKLTPWQEALNMHYKGLIKDLGSSAGLLYAKEYFEKN